MKNHVEEYRFFITQYYVDDSYTGTNFDRPAFKEMILDIESKILKSHKINDIISLKSHIFSDIFILKNNFMRCFYALS